VRGGSEGKELQEFRSAGVLECWSAGRTGVMELWELRRKSARVRRLESENSSQLTMRKTVDSHSATPVTPELLYSFPKQLLNS